MPCMPCMPRMPCRRVQAPLTVLTCTPKSCPPWRGAAIGSESNSFFRTWVEVRKNLHNSLGQHWCQDWCQDLHLSYANLQDSPRKQLCCARGPQDLLRWHCELDNVCALALPGWISMDFDSSWDLWDASMTSMTFWHAPFGKNIRSWYLTQVQSHNVA